MIIDISIRIGNYWFKNGHLYKHSVVLSANGRYKMEVWECLWCGGREHQHRKIGVN